MGMLGQPPSSDVRRRELALSSLGLVSMTVSSLALLGVLRLGLPNGSQGWTWLPVLVLIAPVPPIATLGFAVWGLRADRVRQITAILSIVTAVSGLGLAVIAGLFWLLIRISG